MDMDAATATILGGVITTTVVTIFGYLREGRAHKWAVEQSERERAERLQTAAELKQQHAAVAEQLAHKTQLATALIGQKIDENTVFNVKAIAAGERAYTEANNLTQKIHESGLQLRAASRSSDKPEGV